jgi:membrane fusion protein, multidrug efflux system
MGHLKSLDLPEPGRTPVQQVSQTHAAGSRAWIWVVVVALAAGGYWYYRSSHSKDAQNAAAPAAGAKGTGRGAPGSFSVPVVVASATKGDLPVYLNGLGSVTPLNTVTVRSRVDG